MKAQITTSTVVGNYNSVAFGLFQGRHKRNATFPGGQSTTILPTATIRSNTPNPIRPRYNSCHTDPSSGSQSSSDWSLSHSKSTSNCTQTPQPDSIPTRDRESSFISSPTNERIPEGSPTLVETHTGKNELSSTLPQ